MKKLAIFIAFLFFNGLIFGQSLNNSIRKDIIIVNDSIYIDSLSIVPETFLIFYNDTLIPQNDYSVIFSKSLLIFKQEAFQLYKNKLCKASYRVFPYNFSETFYHKPLILTDNTVQRHYIKKIEDNTVSGINSFSGLETSGSISRGITAGNNQNTGLTSDFNLQISGRISPDIAIQANITDSNIPIQADGSSQNLKEFDNVFIRLISEKATLTAGDLLIKPEEGYFMKFNKKVKGASFSTLLTPEKKYTVHTQFSAAVAKGQYNKMGFNGTEGNQGPYRLTGKNGEQYIIILSGSEKVYIDGKLQERGNENDYVIDYNAGELTFTSKRIITKDTRIIVEFEYSEMNYIRFAAGNSTRIKTKNATFFLNAFSESDAKNQGLSQDLTEEQKLMFRLIGDNIGSAYVSSAVLIDTFNRNEILYKKSDTVVNSSIFQNIYVYSTDSLNAKYRVSFTFTGEKKGNYKQIQNGANGRVFQWVAPVNGIPQGDYEPVKLLVSPKKKQMFNGGVFGRNKKLGNYYLEGAVSNNDVNTLSEIGDKNNIGYAFKLTGSKNFLKKDTALRSLILKTNYQFASRNFNTFEHYKSAEFDRDWNLLSEETGFDEHLAALNLSYFRKNMGELGISSDLLIRDQFYTGNKNSVLIKIKKSNFLVDIHANRLTTRDTAMQTEFIRYNGKTEKSFKHIRIGIKNTGEKNLFSIFSDSLSNKNSYRFNEFESYLQNTDGSKRIFTLSYINREDFSPFENSLIYASTAHNIKFNTSFLNLKNQTLNITANFRKLHVKDSILSNVFGEQTVSGKLRYSFKLFKGTVASSSFYEHTSGNEPVKEYSYFEVQSGQGMFAWKDFNGNKIKELNEFVKANFADEANYIRIALPSSEYKRVYNQSVYEVFNLEPHRLWRSPKGVKKFLALFSNRFMFRLNRKTDTNTDYVKFKIPDSLIISNNNSLKNRFSFNSPKLQTQINYIFINTSVKNILISGIDTKINKFHTFELNKKVKDFIFVNSFKIGNKKYMSEFFSDNNYSIDYMQNEASLNYQIDKKSTIKAKFLLKQKDNIEGEENVSSYSLGGEYRFSSVNQGSFQINFDYTKIRFEGISNTAISYEILEGLKNGKNFLWSVLWYKKLTKSLQLEFNYSGRKTEENKIIHTGGISVRAFF